MLSCTAAQLYIHSTDLIAVCLQILNYPVEYSIKNAMSISEYNTVSVAIIKKICLSITSNHQKTYILLVVTGRKVCGNIMGYRKTSSFSTIALGIIKKNIIEYSRSTHTYYNYKLSFNCKSSLLKKGLKVACL